MLPRRTVTPSPVEYIRPEQSEPCPHAMAVYTPSINMALFVDLLYKVGPVIFRAALLILWITLLTNLLLGRF